MKNMYVATWPLHHHHLHLHHPLLLSTHCKVHQDPICLRQVSPSYKRIRLRLHLAMSVCGGSLQQHYRWIWHCKWRGCWAKGTLWELVKTGVEGQCLVPNKAWAQRHLRKTTLPEHGVQIEQQVGWSTGLLQSELYQCQETLGRMCE